MHRIKSAQDSTALHCNLNIKSAQDRTALHCSLNKSAYYGLDFLLHEGLVDLSQLEATDGLEKASAVVGAGEVGVLQHLLSDLTVELG